MPKPGLPIAALLTRIAVVGLGLALFYEQMRVMTTPVHWVSLLAPAFFLMALCRRRTPSSACIGATPSVRPWSEG